MYLFLLLSLIALGLWLVARGEAKKSTGLRWLGVSVWIAAAVFFGFLSFWGEYLWFAAVDQSGRFWREVGTRVGTAVSGAAAAGGIAFLLTRAHRRRGGKLIQWAPALAAAGGLIWGLVVWQEVLLFFHGVSTAKEDPVYRFDTGFYLFRLPLYDRLYVLFVWTVAVAVGAVVLPWLSRFGQRRFPATNDQPPDLRPTRVATFWIATMISVGCLLAVLHLIYSRWGVVAGPGWTDVHVRIPVYVLVAVAVFLLGLAPTFRWWPRLVNKALRKRLPQQNQPVWTLAVCWAGISAVCLLGLVVVPGIVQWLIVDPNEITFETPYIRHNIDFTRRGFRLHDVEERQFPASDELTEQMLQENQNVLSEVRLWDYRALDSVYRQFQEIRLYYEFDDVDIDRYTLGDRYRQVMVSARELNPSNLPEQSQTFVNRRFKYTHGYGLTMATVTDFTPDGLPNLLLKDIPPKAAMPELEVTEPRIYYGELTDEPAVGNSTEEEFDHPSGDQNAYIHYPGQGGVLLRNLWRKFVFGWKFDGTKFFFSSYPRAESRFLFHRQIHDRVSTLAPFLEFDEDPYAVLIDGRIHWIVDAYTTSSYYPYSEPFSGREEIEYRQGDTTRTLRRYVLRRLDGVNYVRNSVKAVVDAFDGHVDFYVMEPEDPVIRTWQRAFPELFQDRELMPEAVRNHIRYPEDLLLVQGLVYAKYHMDDPAVFYNQEDLWVRATEKYYDQLQPVEPYYVMWELPDSDQAEFVSILPFTPKNRQVLIGWIAGMCDGDNYGRFLAYKFPKESRVLGPQQVETKIDQDRHLSSQLTLWDQRGSRVIRGNVLALPLEDTLLYVEPIYLQAETAAYPELRLVAVMHGDRLRYAETFEQALENLMERTTASPGVADGMGAPPGLALEARQALEDYFRLLGEKRFEDAAAKLRTLEDRLEQLTNPTANENEESEDR